MVFSIRCRFAMPAPYTDHHVHLLSTAAARLSIDVSSARDLGHLGQMVREHPRPGRDEWMRAWGYEEWALSDQRHPTREDLDRIESRWPLMLHHRTGHAAVLNSRALAEIGVAGHPDGILFDRHDLLARVPRLPRASLRSAAEAVSREWSAAGVGAVVDATHTNGPAELEILGEWTTQGVVAQRMTAMISPGAAAVLPPFGDYMGGVRVGWVKLMPSPSRLGEIAGQVAAAHLAGYPVAVHVVEIDVLDATLDAFERSSPPGDLVDRIEHNALCLPEQVARIAACRATVVVNPAFLVRRRPKYDRELAEVERQWLVRIGSLLRAGIAVRAGSDSPVTPSRPEEIMGAAMSHPYSPAESVSRRAAESLLSP